MWSYEHNDYFHHSGIKGMKWGVRRYQNKDGTLTPAGKKRYADNDGDNSQKNQNGNEINRRTVLEKKYRDSGMSQEEAKAAADKRIKVEKAIAITAGVTIAAATAYCVKNKWTVAHCDQVLKAGTTFHNLDSAANQRPGEHLYVNYRKNDTDFFRGQFALGKIKKSGHVFDHALTTTEDIKIPSLNTRKNVFKELYDKDEDFRKAFDRHVYGEKLGNLGKFNSKMVYKRMWSKFGDKDTPEFNVAKRKYFEALRQKGYEAIVDEWDTNKYVYRSDAPMILLNTSSKSFGKMTIKELSAKDVLLSQANSKWYEPIRDMKNSMSLPHTNHFKESTKSLSRHAKTDAKNREYIEKALTEMAKSGKKNTDPMSLALRKQGALIADTGKYLSKHKNMSVKQAQAIAKAKRAAINTTLATATSVVGYSVSLAPMLAVSSAKQQRYIKQYLREHPNTDLTYNQIAKMYTDNNTKKKE